MFPYEYRKYQQEIVEQIRTAIESNNHIILEASTGSGKTICALTATLPYALSHNKKVLYLTRTNAQQRQVILELRQISKLKKVYGLGIQGRHHMCLLLRSEEYRRGTAEELSKLCKDKKDRVINDEDGCVYFATLYEMFNRLSTVKNHMFKTLYTPEEFVEYCESNLICPYELNRHLARSATVIAAPYIYFFDPRIRESFLSEWIHCQFSDIILVVDEAHNLPEYARNLSSAELSLNTLRTAEIESRDFGIKKIFDNIMTENFCRELANIIKFLKNEYIPSEYDDGVVPPNELEVELMNTFNITSDKLLKISKNLLAYGEMIREKRRREGKLPRSYIHSVGGFLHFWMNIDDEKYIKTVHNIGKLECYCLDSSIIGEIINSCYASVHMSGTLTPLEEYRDSIGLPEKSILVKYPSPFPSENLLTLYVDDVTTKYNELKQNRALINRKIREYITTICERFNKNVAVFFPSFDLMDNFIDIPISRKLYIESREMLQSDIMETVDTFKISGDKGESGVLFSVVGGRLCEGLDFPDKQLEIAIIVGIPYPKPTAKQKALREYYHKKFNKGWEYAVRTPAVRKLRQCIGRLIRKDTDIGCAIILDKRCTLFRNDLNGLRLSSEPLSDIYKFFN